MKKLAVLFVFTLLIGTIFAADEKPGADSNDVVTEEQANQSPSAKVEPAADPNEDDVAEIEDAEVDQNASTARFIPSESISEDLGISFPVDI